MPPEAEMNQDTVASMSPAPEVVETTPEVVSEPTQTPETPPELTLHEKIAAKAAEVEAKRAKEASKEPKKAPETPKSPSLLAEKAPGDLAPKTPETPAFTPNHKVKVMNEDKEIPEWLRPLMKDEASQKQVHELVTKALGLDHVMPKLAQSRQQAQQFQGERDQVLGQINEVKALYARNDLDGFFKKLNIPEEKILQWISSKIEYNQLPQEQKQVLDARKQAEDRAWTAEQHSSSLQSQHELMLGQQVQMALESELARPDVKTVAEAFDARMGKPGSFEAEIRRRGDYAWKTQNALVPPNKLVQELLAFLGPVAPNAPATQPVAPAQAAPAVQNQGQAKQPSVIPNISGRSTSAVKPVVKTLDDIRKRYKEMQSEG